MARVSGRALAAHLGIVVSKHEAAHQGQANKVAHQVTALLEAVNPPQGVYDVAQDGQEDAEPRQ